MNNYAPTSLADVVIGDAFGDDLVRYVADGSLPFPSAGKNGFLIYGPYGMGKTTLANMLPSEIEVLHGMPSHPFVWSQTADDDGKVNSRILKILETAVTVANITASKFSHFVIDELDGFSLPHQRKIRAAMSVNQDNIFYFTTNNVHSIDGGIRNRCHEINMCAAPAIMWLPLVQRILKDRGVSAMSPATLLPLIEPCNGSVRDIVTASQLFAAKLLKQTNSGPLAANMDAADQAAA